MQYRTAFQSHILLCLMKRFSEPRKSSSEFAFDGDRESCQLYKSARKSLHNSTCRWILFVLLHVLRLDEVICWQKLHLFIRIQQHVL